jgi:ABC-type phosphate transport system substrate-binding protein
MVASSLAAVAAPTITNAGTQCVVEQGSTTVWPALDNAQANLQAAVSAGYPSWSTANALGCDINLTANGSTAGKNAVRNYVLDTTGTVARTDLGASSSPLGGADATNMMSFQIGGDAMVIAVRDDNPVTQITAAEVTGIYDGEITTWQTLGGANGKTGTIVPRARINASGTRDDMNRLFKMDRGTIGTDFASATCGADFVANAGTNNCEPKVIWTTGLPRLTTSADEGAAICSSADQIAYTSLATLQTYGAANGCGNGHNMKALPLQGVSYSTYTGTAASWATLAPSGAFVAPSTTTAAAAGTYPAKRQLFLFIPKVPQLQAKYGTGNPGWTDDLGNTKAIATINYMLSTAGQASVGAVGFINGFVAAKQPIPDADIDMNGGIGLTDIGQITGRWNSVNSIPGWIRADVDHNGGVGLSDIGKITGNWGATGFVAP